MSLSSCGLFRDNSPVRVAAIGSLHRNPDRVSAPLSLPDQMLVESIGQGLVTVSANGRIEAGLAERWTVIDDGRSYIFRLRDARWPGGESVRAGEIAATLRQRIASSRLRPLLRSEFQSIRQIRAMTSRVIEIQLRQPRPDLLELLSQPDMTFSRNGRGWGPMVPSWSGRTVTLSVRQRAPTGGEPAPSVPMALLWDSSSAIAATRFAAGDVDAVMGGTFAGWPYLSSANVSSEAIVRDPVDGLFGLAIVGDSAILSDPATRNAIAMAFDRTRLLNAVGVPNWTPRVTMRAEPSSDRTGAGSPVYPAWAELSVADRRAQARATIGTWRVRSGTTRRPELRIAMPTGPGARMMFAWMRADLAAVGVNARMVPAAADADLRLIDEVAPSRDPAWYVRRLNCGRGISCAADTTERVGAIAEAATPAERANAITAAEDIITRHMGFIAIAAPVRWALRNDRAAGLVPNARGHHSLYRIRPSPN